MDSCDCFKTGYMHKAKCPADAGNGKVPVAKIDENTSDGYHTFKELYQHRIALFKALLAKQMDCAGWMSECDKSPVNIRGWRSKLHSDGTMFDGWFIVGTTNSKDQQISYHFPISEWENTNFLPVLDRAPNWDGHTPADVIERLKYI